MTRNCPNCNKEFEINSFTINKIYCCDKCKYELNKERNKDLAKIRRKKRVLTKYLKV